MSERAEKAAQDLLYTIESLQSENDKLKADIVSLRALAGEVVRTAKLFKEDVAANTGMFHPDLNRALAAYSKAVGDGEGK